MEYKAHEIPKFKIPEEMKGYGEGACFMIVHEECGNPNSPLVLIHAFTKAMED